MKCLVVGGTGFLGGAMADALAEAGHSISVVSRRETPLTAKPNINAIKADRFGDLSALKGQSFDWVFDSCAYSPDAVESLLAAVGQGISRYILISSISAYGEFLTPNLSETANVPEASLQDLELAASLDPAVRASAMAYGASYGPLKRACEIKAKQILGAKATSLRVGLLVGKGDYSDRLTWWVRRIDEATGDRTKVPAPAPPTRPLQLIDVRDAAEFAVRCAKDELEGIWNVTGEPKGFAKVLAAVADVSGSDAEIAWVPESAIIDAKIVPWVDVPMMAPAIPEFSYFMDVSTEKARSAGLSCRPIEQTLELLLKWDRNRRNITLKVGMTAEQEARLLA